MKSKIIFISICCIFTSLINPLKSSGADYYLDTYYGTTPAAPKALLHRGTAPAFANNDNLYLDKSLDAANQSIGNLGNFALNIYGQGHTIDGKNTYSGFSLGTTSSIYKFDTINLNNFFTGGNGSAITSIGRATIIGSGFMGNGIMTSGTSTFIAANGGAIYNTAASVTNITGSTFGSTTPGTGNIAVNGGAMYIKGNTTIDSTTSFVGNGSISGVATTEKGGAIYNNCDTGRVLTLNGTNFSYNKAIDGGAIYNSPDTSSSAITSINGGTYSNNTATARGGAIHNRTGTTTIKNATFTDNHADISGGAIYNISGVVFNIESSTFSRNTSVNGGALFDTASGTTNITKITAGSNFDHNSADVSGGAIYANGPINIAGGSYSDNFAAVSGGALYSVGGATVNSATFTGNGVDGLGNITTNGGAIYNSSSGTLDLTNTNFSTNSATTSGGAIYNAGALYVKANGANSTFTGNTAANGADIYNTGTVYLNAGAGNSITFDDTLASDVNTRAININSTTGSPTLIGGTVNFNNDISTSALNIFNGTTNIGKSAISNVNVDDVAVNITGGNQVLTNNTFKNGSRISISNPTAGTSTTVTGSTFNGGSYSGSGGAINVAAGTLSVTSSNFNNYAVDANGGAIYNSGTATISNSSFKNNSASINGGAIYNTTSSSLNLTLTNTDFTTNTATNGSGGAIYNTAVADITGGTYDGNSAKLGGAITNNGGTVTDSSSTFKNNSASLDGGAVYNTGGTSTLTNSNFTSNTATNGSGGAIYNAGTLGITGGTYDGNSAKLGGAITNNGGTVTDGSSTFKNNSASLDGGAIYNTGGTSTLTNSNFTSNTATNGSGGAIYNGATSAAVLNITGGTYASNSAKYGGAISNDKGDATIAGATFTSNSATSGGAVLNGRSMTITDSTFSGNSATTLGGAIYNAGTLGIRATTGNSTTFTTTADTLYLESGTANLDGIGTGVITFAGAIDSLSNSNVINVNSLSPTSTGTINFNNRVTNATINIFRGTVNFGENISLANDKLNISGGTSNFINQNFGTSNPIILSGGVMNLNSGNGGSSSINDTISGAGTININKAVGSNPTGGTVNVNNSITGGATINLYNGTMALSNESYLNGDNLGIYGGTLNTQNGLTGTMALNNLTFWGIANWLIDVDLANVIGDKITSANPATGAGSLNISNINLWSDASAVSTAIIVANGNAKNNVGTSVTSVNGALFTYAVSYDGSGPNGVLNFLKTGVSPNAVTSDVAQTSTFLLQTAIDRQFFGNVDAFMSFPLATRESTICCALAHDPTSGYTGGACPLSGNGTFSPIYSCDLNKGIWVKDFVSFENIPLRNGPNVSTVEYGTLIGADAPLRYLGHGIVGNTSAYVGYLGSNQNYDNVGVSQNGVLVGLAENMVYKNTFLTLMTSVGSSLGNANTPYGTDHFSSLFAGVAAKGGYNFEFKEGEYIIQPNLMLAYTFTNTPDYTTASGINMSSKPLNAMQIAPGVRLIKNMRYEKGQVYLVANWVYNVMDNTRFTANDVQLPQLAIAPYIEYGIGYQRVWKERFTGFAQTLFRGGGRNGVALQFGLRWAI